jgi:hypothetical protein
MAPFGVGGYAWVVNYTGVITELTISDVDFSLFHG